MHNTGFSMKSMRQLSMNEGGYRGVENPVKVQLVSEELPHDSRDTTILHAHIGGPRGRTQ